MSGARINFGFIPLPHAVVDDPEIDLSQGEFRLLCYLLRHRFRVKSEQMRLSQDELLSGVRSPDGQRRDRGCRITSGRDLKAARERLEARGWLKVTTVGDAGLVYEVCIDGEDQPSANCTGASREGASASCSDSQCNLSPLPVQNALAIREEKVKEEETPTEFLLSSAEAALPSQAAVIALPLIGGKVHTVTEDELAMWEQAYSSRRCAGGASVRILPWLHANPDKQSRSVKGSRQRVVRWLTREQDKGGRNATNQRDRDAGTYTSPAAQRQRDSHDAILAAAARRYGIGADALHGRSAGALPEPAVAERHA